MSWICNSKSVKRVLGLALGLGTSVAIGQDLSPVAPSANDNVNTQARAVDTRDFAGDGFVPTDLVYPQGACACAGGTPEGEPCAGPANNDGCNSPTQDQFGTVTLGQTICGTARATGGTRDTDWYELTLAQATELSITVTAEFTPVLFILDANNCAAIGVVAVAAGMGVQCSPATLNTTIGPGTFTVFVSVGNAAGQGVFEGFPCAANNNSYTLSVQGVADIGACCQPNAACIQTNEAGCLSSNGIFFQGQTCAQLPPGTCPNQGAPDNEFCFSAETLVVNGPSLPGSTLFASPGDVVPQCSGIAFENGGAWYTLTNGGTAQQITVATSGAEFAANIGVFTNEDDDFCSGTFCCVAAEGLALSDCCTPNGGLGCEDEDCEALVCAADEFCCDTLWDQLCADAASTLCGDLCDGEAGDATVTFCAAANQTYKIFVSGPTAGDFSISADSGAACTPNSGSCVVCDGDDEGEPCGGDVNGGCNSAGLDFGAIAVGQTICGTAWADGGNRDTDWFNFTIAETSEVTITLDHDLSTGSSFFLIDSSNCANIPFFGDGSSAACDTGEIVATLQPGTYTIFVGQSTFEGAPCPPPGDVCGGVGVNYALTLAVGAPPEPCDLTCNGTTEANACAQGTPGEPIPGTTCCAPNGGVGCNDAECQAAVCGADPFCCDTEWDQICADQALTLCADVCNVGGTDDPNGGCNNAVPAFGVIANGQTICGQAPASGGTRDTDWYNITIGSTTDVTLTLTSQFPATAFLLDATDCGAIELLGQVVNEAADGGSCNTASATFADIAPGSYTVFVGAGDEAGGIFEGVFCNENAGYGVTIDFGGGAATGACCQGACECTIETQADCTAAGGVYNGDGSTCGGNGACTDACPGDLNLDGTSNSVDLNILLAAFGSNANGDLDCNGVTNSVDLNLLLAAFGDTCN